jgi:hypothetical protein
LKADNPECVVTRVSFHTVILINGNRMLPIQAENSWMIIFYTDTHARALRKDDGAVNREVGGNRYQQYIP